MVFFEVVSNGNNFQAANFLELMLGNLILSSEKTIQIMKNVCRNRKLGAIKQLNVPMVTLVLLNR